MITSKTSLKTSEKNPKCLCKQYKLTLKILVGAQSASILRQFFKFTIYYIFKKSDLLITSKASFKTSEKNPECRSEQQQYRVIIFRSCTKFIVTKLVLIF